MVLSDEVALGELYKLAIDCDTFPQFKLAFQAHIDVSRSTLPLRPLADA